MFGDVWIELEPNPGAGHRVRRARSSAARSPRGFFAGIEKGVRETAAEGVLAGYPLDRLQGDPLRRLVPPGRLQRALVQARGVDGPQGGRAAGQARPARADHDRRCPDPRAVHGRGQPRPQRPPRPRAGHGPRGRDAGHHGPRPAGRAVLVRDRAAVAHGRTRHVQLRRSTTTRTCRRTSPRRSSRRTRRSTPRGTEPGEATPPDGRPTPSVPRCRAIVGVARARACDRRGRPGVSGGRRPRASASARADRCGPRTAPGRRWPRHSPLPGPRARHRSRRSRPRR